MPMTNPGKPRAQDVDRHVGARMRHRRVTLGLTQQQMADLIGVTYQQAHKYEKGINRIAAGRLYSIAKALGVDVGYFFEDVGKGGAEGHPATADDVGAGPELRRNLKARASRRGVLAGARAEHTGQTRLMQVEATITVPVGARRTDAGPGLWAAFVRCECGEAHLVAFGYPSLEEAMTPPAYGSQKL